MIYLYILGAIGVSVYLSSLWSPKGGFWVFIVTFGGVNTICYYAYNLLEQLKRKNDILQGDFQKKIQDEQTRLQKIEKYLKVENEKLEERKKAIEVLAEEKSKGFPWLAKAYADYTALKDDELAHYLDNKKRPAHSSAEIVRDVKRTKRLLIEENKMVNYIVQYYESLFPWLADLRDIDNDELTALVENQDQRTESVSDRASKWLTESEYKNLSSAEKYQKALDRYQASKKSKWEIGRDFERYIGYEYEQKGFKVEYQGIIDGFEDLGRDLICKLNDKIHIVQCKYWSHNKTIHEKHINQLLGTTIMYYLQLNHTNNRDIQTLSRLMEEKKIVPVFITSATISDTARQFANALGVKLREGESLQKYPLIKCNLNPTTKEKIYHLPFDQQYDKTMVSGNGECYAWTVHEAENKGFRRAMRWHGLEQ